MSNTAEVVSYDAVTDLAPIAEAASTIAEVGGAVLAAGAFALAATVEAGIRAAQAIVSESVQERAGREANERRDNAASLSAEKARVPCELRLDQGDRDALLIAARNLGYQELPTQPGTTALQAFAHRNGELLVIKRANDRLNVITNAGRTAIDQVMQESQRLRARAFLERFSGGQVTERRLANGQIELKAREISESRSDGRAAIELTVASNGTLASDVSGIRGNRCEKVLADLTSSVGGKVRAKKIKPDYHSAKTSPVKTVKVGR